MASEMMQAFAQGAAFADATEDKRQRRLALSAAVDQYGDTARDPGLFAALQNIEFAKTGESRAARGFEQDFSTAQAREGREAQKFTRAAQADDMAKRQQATLGMVQGLRAARDRGEDVGTAFDRFDQSGLFDQLGVDPADKPAMRQAVIDNPAVLDDYLASLSGEAKPVKVSEKEQARVIMNDPNATDADKQWATGIMGGAKAFTTGAGTDSPQDARQRARISDTVQQMLGSLDTLEELGSVKSAGGAEGMSAAGRLGRSIKTSAVGRYVGDFVGTDASRERDNLVGLRSTLLGIFAQNPDLSSKMFDSNAEKELWLQQFGRPDMTVEAQRDLLNTFEQAVGEGRTLGAGDLPATVRDGAQQPAQTPTTKTQIYPGYVNPKTGARFKGGDWKDERNWEAQ